MATCLLLSACACKGGQVIEGVQVIKSERPSCKQEKVWPILDGFQGPLLLHHAFDLLHGRIDVTSSEVESDTKRNDSPSQCRLQITEATAEGIVLLYLSTTMMLTFEVRYF